MTLVVQIKPELSVALVVGQSHIVLVKGSWWVGQGQYHLQVSNVLPGR